MIHLQNAEFVRSAAKKEDFPRDGLPQIVFSGRSNVGKSSVINRILNRKNFARVGNAPGKTSQLFQDRRQVLSGGPSRVWIRQGVTGGEGPLGQADPILV